MSLSPSVPLELALSSSVVLLATAVEDPELEDDDVLVSADELVVGVDVLVEEDDVDSRVSASVSVSVLACGGDFVSPTQAPRLKAIPQRPIR